MPRHIVAIILTLLVLLAGSPSLALDAAAEAVAQHPEAGQPRLEPSPAELFLEEWNEPLRERYSASPKARLLKKGDLQALCFTPQDDCVHYIGANIDEEVAESPSDSVNPLTAGPPTEDKGWALKLGAGLEKQFGERAALDLDYRYTSSPVAFDLETLQLPSAHEHHISAGMKLLF